MNWPNLINKNSKALTSKSLFDLVIEQMFINDFTLSLRINF